MSLHISAKLLYPVVVLFCVSLTYLGSCHAKPQCVESEREALLEFKNGIRVDSCGLLDSWGGSHDCCRWYGIHCNNHTGHVTGLHLSGNDHEADSMDCLQGTLSASLVELKHLKYLGLSYNNFTGQTIPKFIGSLANLETLNLANNGFHGRIPPEIGNLSRLTSLDLGCTDEMDCTLSVKSLSWLLQLRLLRKLDLGSVDMSLATNWLSVVNNLPFLKSLNLVGCSLSLKLPSSLSYINSTTSLSSMSLRYNNLNDTSIFEWLFNLTGLDTTLVSLDLSINHQMFGSKNLEPITQRVMKFLGNLCSLQTLWLEDTSLSYDISDIVHALSGCPHKSLESLDLSENQVWGSIPDSIGTFSSLTDLSLYSNQLNGSLSPALGQLSMLEDLDLRSNFLKGVVTTGLLSNLTELTGLYLSNNSDIVIDISDDWNPPFQLQLLFLGSCKIGPRFPNWLITQKALSYLDISNAGISDSISIALTKSLFHPGLMFLNMSQNMIYGVLPDIPSVAFENLPVIDLGYNNLEGALPLFLRKQVSDLRLNNNKLSQGFVPFLCPKTRTQLIYLDLSNNLFSAKLPDCWRFFDKLSVLQLHSNSLWGNLPSSIGTLDQLKFLHLHNNNLSGELPTSLVNCTSLLSLDLAYNSLTGYIPHAIGHSFKNLSILILRSNHLSGDLPSSVCHLSRLQILDISRNHISGTIPRCVYDLKGMTDAEDRLQNISVFYGYYSAEGATYDNEWIMWKRQERSFKGGIPLGSLKGIDMSDNKLEGQIPDEISSLVGLRYLNLSRNNLSGGIPSRTGQMVLLESLDLSHNNLSGQIPASLAQIDDLGTLDVSYNNLSGRIPTGTQLQGFTTAYMGNPGLCGTPLPKCTIPQNGENSTTQQNEHISNADDIYPGLYVSVVLGFIVGFWGVCGTLVIKRSWRIAFFRFYDDMKDKVHVMLVVHTPRAWRRS